MIFWRYLYGQILRSDFAIAGRLSGLATLSASRLRRASGIHSSFFLQRQAVPGGLRLGLVGSRLTFTGVKPSHSRFCVFPCHYKYKIHWGLVTFTQVRFQWSPRLGDRSGRDECLKVAVSGQVSFTFLGKMADLQLVGNSTNDFVDFIAAPEGNKSRHLVHMFRTTTPSLGKEELTARTPTSWAISLASSTSTL